MPNPNGNSISLLRKPVGSISRGAKKWKLTELHDLQDDMKAIAQDDTRKPMERARATAEWRNLVYLSLGLRGKPLPAPVKVEAPAKSRSRSGLVPPAPRVAEPEPSQVAETKEANAATHLDGARVKDARILNPGTVKQNPSEPITPAEPQSGPEPLPTDQATGKSVQG